MGQLVIKKPTVPNEIQMTVMTREFLMEHSIGKSNAVTLKTLFENVFGNPNKYNNFQMFVFVARLKEVMRRLRNQKNFFVVPIKDKDTGEYLYCIPTSQNDLYDYVKIYERNSKKYRAKINKGQAFVKSKAWTKWRQQK